MDTDEGWEAYYAKTGGRPPRETLLRALSRSGTRSGSALDLGCGGGRDAIALLRRGWAVTAVDAEEAALDCVRRRPDLPPGASLRTARVRFEDFAASRWPFFDLVNGSFCLPLCAPRRFPGFWRALRACLRPGGRLAGHLFGDRDGWADDPTITCLPRAEVERLLDGLAVEFFREEETDAVTPRGRSKHWHLFHFVGRVPQDRDR